MPARVDCRLGNIFDDACDLVVIPSSVGGTLTPEMQQAVRREGLPFPSAMTRGQVIVLPSSNPRYGAVAYAATVAGQTASDLVVYGIGRALGVIAAEREVRKISSPVLGSGSGDLPAPLAAAALARGFQETAPELAELWISVRNRTKFRAVAIRLLGVVPPAQEPERPGKAPTRTTPPEPWITRRERAAEVVPRLRPAASRRKGVFISYSHADAEWLERLQKHLRPLEREGVEIWDDTRLRPGEPWREEIREALAAAKVAILLISADFLASDFIVTDELPPLLKAAEGNGATILPVIISPSRFTRMESLSRFQSVNDPKRPLVKMRRASSEAVLDQVAQAVEEALKR